MSERYRFLDFSYIATPSIPTMWLLEHGTVGNLLWLWPAPRADPRGCELAGAYRVLGSSRCWGEWRRDLQVDSQAMLPGAELVLRYLDSRGLELWQWRGRLWSRRLYIPWYLRLFCFLCRVHAWLMTEAPGDGD